MLRNFFYTYETGTGSISNYRLSPKVRWDRICDEHWVCCVTLENDYETAFATSACTGWKWFYYVQNIPSSVILPLFAAFPGWLDGKKIANSFSFAIFLLLLTLFCY